LKCLLDTLSLEDTRLAIEFSNTSSCSFRLGSDSGLTIRVLSLQQVCELLRFGNTSANIGVGPVVVLKCLEVIVFALKEGLRGDLGVGLCQRLLVNVQIALGEALVGKKLELIVLLNGTVLCSDVLVGCDALTILAFEDIGLAGSETLDMLAEDKSHGLGLLTFDLRHLVEGPS
jgi:hypothetical protein